MENTVDYGVPNLFIGPRGVAVAKTDCHQPAHAAIHPDRLLEALLRSHGAINRNLVRVGFALMVRFCLVGHVEKVRALRLRASLRRGRLASLMIKCAAAM
jgi:hypothetical protein